MTDVVLNYKESILRQSDVDLLKCPCWLNDTLTSFYFKFLQHERFRHHNGIIFVPPQVTECIKVAPSDEIDVILNPLDPHGKNFILFALSNNEYIEPAGGTHWSLLVFSWPDQMVIHFDSMQGCNRNQAKDLARKLLKYFGLPFRLRFTEAFCLQQTNGYDCGIHVLCTAENLANYAPTALRASKLPPLDPTIVMRKRNDILDIIDYLKEKQRQHHS